METSNSLNLQLSKEEVQQRLEAFVKGTVNGYLKKLSDESHIPVKTVNDLFFSVLQPKFIQQGLFPSVRKNNSFNGFLAEQAKQGRRHIYTPPEYP